jgi:hypothetical protein
MSLGTAKRCRPRVIRIVTPARCLRRIPSGPSLRLFPGAGDAHRRLLHINSGRLETGSFPTAVALSEIDAFNPEKSCTIPAFRPEICRSNFAVDSSSRVTGALCPRYAAKWLKPSSEFLRFPFSASAMRLRNRMRCAVLRILKKRNSGLYGTFRA